MDQMRRNVNYSSMNPPSVVVASSGMTASGAVNPLSCMSLLSIFGFAFVPLFVWFLLFNQSYECPDNFNGGSPHQSGTCFCSQVDSYCLCTPTVIIEGILEYRAPGTAETDPDCLQCQFVALETVEFPRVTHYKLPNSFLYVGNSPESALHRELQHFNNVSFTHPEQVHMYSELYTQDNYISMVYSAQVVSPEYSQKSRVGEVVLPYFKNILEYNFRKEHKQIVLDYVKRKYPVLWKHIHVGNHHNHDHSQYNKDHPGMLFTGAEAPRVPSLPEQPSQRRYNMP